MHARLRRIHHRRAERPRCRAKGEARAAGGGRSARPGRRGGGRRHGQTGGGVAAHRSQSGEHCQSGRTHQAPHANAHAH
eukprot:3777002-Prymnesium_polylepis.1